MIQILSLKPEQIEEYWPKLEVYINRALEHGLGEMSAQEVKQKGIDSIYLFLVLYRGDDILGVATVESVTYPTKTIVCIPHAAGKEIDSWRGLIIDTAKRLARERGAEQLVVCGREGWVKKLKPEGFKKQYTMLSLTL